MGVSDFFNNVILSFNSKDEGFSYRKLLSFVIIVMVIYLHVQFATKDNVISFLAYDFGFIAVLLGLLNLDRFVALKFGQTTTTNTTGTQTNTSSTQSQTTTIVPPGGTDPIQGTQSGS